MSTKRISKEFSEISQSPPEGITVTLPASASLHTWHVVLTAPESTPYYPGRFGIVLTLPTEYPFKPPAIKFITRIYHPNVTNDNMGNVCLGVLKAENWKPSTKIVSVLESVRNLLVEPAVDDPLEDAIAEEWKRDRAAWEAEVRKSVEKYAKSEPQFPAA